MAPECWCSDSDWGLTPTPQLVGGVDPALVFSGATGPLPAGSVLFSSLPAATLRWRARG